MVVLRLARVHRLLPRLLCDSSLAPKCRRRSSALWPRLQRALGAQAGLPGGLQSIAPSPAAGGAEQRDPATCQGSGSLLRGGRGGVRKASQKREAEIKTVGGLRRRAEKHSECEKKEL